MKAFHKVKSSVYEVGFAEPQPLHISESYVRVYGHVHQRKPSSYDRLYELGVGARQNFQRKTPIYEIHDKTSGCSATKPAGSCSATKGCSATYALLDPRYNLREVYKQLVLVEDHLSSPEKRCADCIKKHMLTIEAFLDEAITLDKDQKYNGLLRSLLARIHPIRERIFINLENPNNHNIMMQEQQRLRAIRKSLAERKDICEFNPMKKS